MYCLCCDVLYRVQGWDKTYCLQFIPEFKTVHFFGDKTYPVSVRVRECLNCVCVCVWGGGSDKCRQPRTPPANGSRGPPALRTAAARSTRLLITYTAVAHRLLSDHCRFLEIWELCVCACVRVLSTHAGPPVAPSGPQSSRQRMSADRHGLVSSVKHVCVRA